MGSLRYRYGCKRKVEDMLKLDIARLKAIGVDLKEEVISSGGTITWTRGYGYYSHKSSVGYFRNGDTFTLNYRHNDEPVKEDIRLARTPCNYGGSRVWFVCPQCGRCVRCLYGSKYFRCRKCHDLIYTSQCDNQIFRLISKYNAIKERMGGKPGIEPILFKPKWMRWNTFSRLHQELQKVEATWVQAEHIKHPHFLQRNK